MSNLFHLVNVIKNLDWEIQGPNSARAYTENIEFIISHKRKIPVNILLCQ